MASVSVNESAAVNPRPAKANNFYQEFGLWLMKQGPAWVLVAAGFWWIDRQIPTHLQQIEKGYERNAEVLKAGLTEVAASNDRTRELMEKVIFKELKEKQ